MKTTMIVAAIIILKINSANSNRNRKIVITLNIMMLRVILMNFEKNDITFTIIRSSCIHCFRHCLFDGKMHQIWWMRQMWFECSCWNIQPECFMQKLLNATVYKCERVFDPEKCAFFLDYSDTKFDRTIISAEKTK